MCINYAHNICPSRDHFQQLSCVFLTTKKQCNEAYHFLHSVGQWLCVSFVSLYLLHASLFPHFWGTTLPHFMLTSKIIYVPNSYLFSKLLLIWVDSTFNKHPYALMYKWWVFQLYFQVLNHAKNGRFGLNAWRIIIIFCNKLILFWFTSIPTLFEGLNVFTCFKICLV